MCNRRMITLSYLAPPFYPRFRFIIMSFSIIVLRPVSILVWNLLILTRNVGRGIGAGRSPPRPSCNFIRIWWQRRKWRPAHVDVKVIVPWKNIVTGPTWWPSVTRVLCYFLIMIGIVDLKMDIARILSSLARHIIIRPVSSRRNCWRENHRQLDGLDDLLLLYRMALQIWSVDRHDSLWQISWSITRVIARHQSSTIRLELSSWNIVTREIFTR